MLEFLPLELLISVLLNLPIKALIQCTSVCKSWQSLITSPIFISTHLRHQKTQLLLHQYCLCFRIDRLSLRSDSESVEEIQRFKFRFRGRKFPRRTRVVDSCGGLVCVSASYHYFNGTIIVCNPIIHKSLTLHCPRVNVYPRDIIRHLVGFGFDYRTNDFKVVTVIHHGDVSDFKSDLRARFNLDVNVFSLRTSSWQQITSPAPPHILRYKTDSECQAYINGAVHWIVQKPLFRTKEERFIMLFDMVNEVFGEMMLPTSLATFARNFNICIAVFGEWLSVYEYKDYVNSDAGYTSCAIWIMKEYGVVESWTKQLVVKIDTGIEMILGLRKNGDLLLSSTRYEELLSYNPKSQQIKQVGIRRAVYSSTFTASLVMIKSFHGASIVGTSNIFSSCQRQNYQRLASKEGKNLLDITNT